MSCDEFSKRIDQLLDQRLPLGEDQPLRHHAARCGRCRRRLRAYEDLLHGLDRFEAPSLSEDFSVRVVAHAQPARRQRSGGRQWMMVAALALAASLLLALIPIGNRRRKPNVAPRQDVANTIGTKPAKETPIATPVESPSPTSQTDRLAAGSPFDAALIDAAPIREMLDQIAPDLPYDRMMPIHEITGGLKPITNSLATALGVLRSTLPLGRADGTKEASTPSASTSPIPPGCISV